MGNLGDIVSTLIVSGFMIMTILGISLTINANRKRRIQRDQQLDIIEAKIDALHEVMAKQNQ